MSHDEVGGEVLTRGCRDGTRLSRLARRTDGIGTHLSALGQAAEVGA